MLGSALGLSMAGVFYWMAPTPPGYVAKVAQFLGAAFAFAGAVGVPGSQSFDGDTLVEKANEAGVFMLAFFAFALGSYGVMVSP